MITLIFWLSKKFKNFPKYFFLSCSVLYVAIYLLNNIFLVFCLCTLLYHSKFTKYKASSCSCTNENSIINPKSITAISTTSTTSTSSINGTPTYNQIGEKWYVRMYVQYCNQHNYYVYPMQLCAWWLIHKCTCVCICS